jgi:hypothetical protein
VRATLRLREVIRLIAVVAVTGLLGLSAVEALPASADGGGATISAAKKAKKCKKGKVRRHGKCVRKARKPAAKLPPAAAPAAPPAVAPAPGAPAPTQAGLTVSAPGAVTAGVSFTPTAASVDGGGATLADVTAQTTFSLTPDGGCVGAVCSATVAGAHTLTATSGGFTATQTVTIQAGPIARLALSPTETTVSPQAPQVPSADYEPMPSAPGPTQTFTTQGFDAFDNPLGDVTGQTTFSVLGAGSCTVNVCRNGIPGNTATVVATLGTVTATAPITTATVAASFLMSCRGENYDLDDNLLSGCESSSPGAGHGTAALALPIGSFSCENANSAQNFTGVVVSDERSHLNPVPSGFNSSTGSTPEFHKLLATGGPICNNDLQIKVKTTGGSSATQCYKLNITGTTSPQALEVSGAGTAELELGNGAYSSGATITFGFERTCAKARERVQYTVTGHL